MKAQTKNLAAFEKLLGACNAHGAFYNPGNASIGRTALNALLEEAQKSIDAVHKAQGNLTKAINLRQHAFDALPYLGTRVVSIAAAHDMDLAHVKDLNRLRLRFRSQPFRSTVEKMPEGSGPTATSDSTNETLVRKNRQLGYDALVETLAEMITFLEAEANYNPTEAALSVAGLKETLSALNAHNAAVSHARESLRSARAMRSKVMFTTSGIYGIGMKVKKYFKAIFGATSEAYLPIRKLRFVTR